MTTRPRQPLVRLAIIVIGILASTGVLAAAYRTGFGRRGVRATRNLGVSRP